MTFAIIKTGGKQYKVREGDVITIEKLAGDFKEGDKVTFDEVLLTDDGNKTEVGTPSLGKKVEGKFVEEFKGPKVRIQKFKAKSNYDKVIGHRQTHHKVEITKV